MYKFSFKLKSHCDAMYNLQLFVYSFLVNIEFYKLQTSDSRARYFKQRILRYPRFYLQALGIKDCYKNICGDLSS